MTHLSHETARRLKAAGFPQPMPSVGQTWYSLDEEGKAATDLLYIFKEQVDSYGGPNFLLGSLFYGGWMERSRAKGYIFCPTVQEIIEQLPPGTFVSMLGPDKWVCAVDAPGYKKTEQIYGKNAAEACAEAYLYTQSLLAQ